MISITLELPRGQLPEIGKNRRRHNPVDPVDLCDACEEGGCHFTKWISRNRVVLESVPECERAKEVRDLDLDHNDLPLEL